MPRSSTERRWYPLLLAAAAALGAPAAPAQVTALGPNRLVSVIDVAAHDEQVDVTMVFNCSMRFLSNLPASEGRVVRIQLAPLPDCGMSPLALIPSETPPLLGGAAYVSIARLESTAPGQVTLSIEFRQNEQFV